ncbi:MAG: 16S rRNA (guanine(527)-N(7))-methyltransferase RsmG [Alphaproteobacteria bacterium]|nr:16S rRNA (guanine(527)-N(7))-methyltransferase RsmG [Alphaproteobacteria bacterium]MBU0859258.1 16S rRNA (guanine(527)-N(7))-methyltransferase RsmG [Alphaproteobacteria bacterium]
MIKVQPDISFPTDKTGQLEQYHQLLLKWQKTLNLVGPATLDTAWDRHFLDSVQLAPLLPAHAKTLFDLGSGAGFPGMVLAIMRPELGVHLVESDQRKATFLRNVSRETGCRVTVHDVRIEDMQAQPVPDVVTARALAALDQLLDWCMKWAEANPELVLILPKGERAEDEIAKAQTYYNFVVDTHASMTAPEARILRVSQLSRRG